MRKPTKHSAGHSPGHGGVGAPPVAWSRPLRRDEVPEGGLAADLVADEPTRAALAWLAAVVAIPRAEAVFEVSRRGAGLQIVGTVRASVIQNCVVTLEPITNEVDEPVEAIYLPPDEAAAQATPADPEVDPPEPLVDDTVDLGRVATEFLLLGIDPYPRKPDVQFEAPAAKDDGGGPFAALAALRPAVKKDEQD